MNNNLFRVIMFSIIDLTRISRKTFINNKVMKLFNDLFQSLKFIDLVKYEKNRTPWRVIYRKSSSTIDVRKETFSIIELVLITCDARLITLILAFKGKYKYLNRNKDLNWSICNRSLIYRVTLQELHRSIVGKV